MAIYFTSDEHYGHANIIKFCKRPFATTSEMTETLIANHNAIVQNETDLTFHLGDMFWRTLPLKEALEIFYRLNGQHAFIWGNHDELIKGNQCLRDCFSGTIGDIQVIHIGNQRLVLCHYAMYVFHGSHRGAWQLYGHTHAALPDFGTLALDVGVDAWDFKPVSFEQISEKMAIKKALGHGDPMIPIMKKRPWGTK